MAGEQYTLIWSKWTAMQAKGLIHRTSNALRSTLSLCVCRNCCQSIVGWIQTEGVQSFTRKDINSKGLHAFNWDVSFGGLKNFDNGLLVGVAGNYRTHQATFHQRGKADWNTAEGAIYWGL